MRASADQWAFGIRGAWWWAVIALLAPACADEGPEGCPGAEITQIDLRRDGRRLPVGCIRSDGGEIGVDRLGFGPFVQRLVLEGDVTLVLGFPGPSPESVMSFPTTLSVGGALPTTVALEIPAGDGSSSQPACSAASGTMRIDGFTVDDAQVAADGMVVDRTAYFESFVGAIDLAFEHCDIESWALVDEPVAIEGAVIWSLR